MTRDGDRPLGKPARGIPLGRSIAFRRRVLSPLAIAFMLATVSAAAETALGDRDAPVTIVEYFSFSCPHCARFHREILPKLKRDYIETGKARLVFRDFPLNLAALSAAHLSRCAGPERRLEIIDLFWHSWDAWIDEPDPSESLLEELRGAGLSEAAIERCREDRSLEQEVLASYLEGSRDHGVDRTPTFLVNGRKYVGLVSYERLAAIIRTLLE